MDIDLSERHRQVLGLESLRRKRGYKEGWLYHLCRQKGLLAELHDLQMAGRIGDSPPASANQLPRPPAAIETDEEGRVVLAPRTLLTVEMVPRTAWFTNLRSALSKEDWDRLRRLVYERAGNRCEICGGRGGAHPVECHEVWEYDDRERVQRLAGLVALCPACHEAKHMGRASSVGRGGAARAHLARVNGWSMADVELYLETEFEVWSRRSGHEWQPDL
jgi:hypothetical protein